MKTWGTLGPPVRGSIVMIVSTALVLALVGASKAWMDQVFRVEPGRLPAWALVAGASRDVTFQIPGGSVDLMVKSGQETVRDTDDRERLKAPAGGRLVEVDWRSVGSPQDDSWLDVGEMPPAKVWLRSGDERALVSGVVRLPQSDDADEDRGIAVAFGSRKPVEVELEFAGRRQSVEVISGRRTMGSFAPLYRASTSDSRQQEGRSSDRTRTLRWSSKLSVDDARTPYHPDLGWAKKGREWLVLERAQYSVEDVGGVGSAKEHTYVIADAKPSGSVRATDGRVVQGGGTARGAGQRAEYQPAGTVFEIPRGGQTALRFTLRLRLESDSTGASGRSFTATRTLEVPAVPEAGGDR